MRTIVLAFVLGSALAATGCAGVKQKAMEINPGDNKTTVIAKLGEPDDRQFQGTLEALQYGRVVSIGVCDYTVVWLAGGKTTGITSYRNYSTMGCRHGLKSVRWEDAPDATVEIRQR